MPRGQEREEVFFGEKCFVCSTCLLPSVRAAVSKFVGVFHALAVHCGIDSQDRPNIIDVCELKLRNGQFAFHTPTVHCDPG